MKEISLKKRILAPLTLAIAVLLGGFIYNVYRSSFNEVTYDVERELESVDKLFAKQVEAESELISSIIELIKQDHHIRDAWLERDRARLLELCAPVLSDIKSKMQITHFYFHDANRVNFLRVYNPSRYGDIIDRTTLLKAETAGVKSSGIELGKLGTLTIRVVHPWIIDGQLSGFIEMGEDIDQIVEKLHDILGVELYVSIYKEYLKRADWQEGMALFERKGNWDQFPSSVVINNTREEIPKEFTEFLKKGRHQYMEMEADLQLEIDNKFYRVGVIPIFDIADREIGDIVMLYDVTPRISSLRESVLITGFLCFLVGMCLFALFLKFIGTIELQLDKYRNHLEELVQNRTEELTTSNFLLEEEIREHKATEKALVESEKRYRSFVQDFKGIAFRKDVTNKGHVFFHGAVEELTGYSERNFTTGTVTWESIIHPDEHSRQRNIDRLTTEPNSSFKGEYQIICKDGSLKWIFENIYNISNEEGEPLFIEGTLHDITERKKLEEELKKTRNLESLGILAGGIAHDFNNLLTGIRGNISISKMNLEPESKAFEVLTRAEKATERASTLTQQLLTFSKGGEPIKMSTNITDLLKESISFVLSGSRVLSSYNISEELWPVDVDRGQLGQVVHNLTLNALEAMPDGGTLQVHAQNEVIEEDDTVPLPPGRYVRLIFEDKGRGIEKNILHKIFDPYFTTKKSGNGLGLSATYSIIRKHKGFIQVDSEPGQGTSISIYLPTSQESPHQEVVAAKAILRGKGRILLMDDEEIIRDVVAESLTNIGYQVDVTQNGDETILCYLEAYEKKSPYDAVILDLTIPGGKGGKETISELHRINPQAKVIVSSGYSQDPIMSDYKKYGFSGIVPKPFNMDELCEVLQEIIFEG